MRHLVPDYPDRTEQRIDKASLMTMIEEHQRVAALQALDILSAPREPALDRIVHMVRSEFGARHAGIMLIDHSTAVFAARSNISLKSVPRKEAFCNITIQNDAPLIIRDALSDPRIIDQPPAKSGIRSYAGIPLRTRAGYCIGSLCVFDTELLRFPATKIRKMRELALLAMDCIELRRLSVQDHLTGALNRRGFMSELEREMRKQLRKPHRPLTLALMDLDHFKQINDRFGHPAGDQVLQAVAELATELGSPVHLIGRLGGEEFGILMPDHDEDSAFGVIERLRLAIEQFRLPNLPDLRVTASFGLTETDGKAMDISSLMASADSALYHAKAGSRNMTVRARSIPTPN